MKKTADTLERGDVIVFEGGRWVVIEPSDQVDTISAGEKIPLWDGRGKSSMYDVSECCEPRIQKLGRTGRVTHEVTYIIMPNRRTFTVREFLDLDIRSAVPEPVA